MPSCAGSRLEHRDYLGALLGLGLRREKLGDCLVLDNGYAVIFVAAEVASFIEQHLDRVGRHTVVIKRLEGEFQHQPPPPREYKASVASLRLDAIIAAAYHLPRTKAARLIEQGKVRVNWRVRTDPAMRLTEGDMISCRGYGRVWFLRHDGYSKKGKERVVLGFPP
ncbi:MAG: hypothetical protein H0Z39_02770 [Peptococcaceae bacterium]|nr:hypothetical protein [Peptococcaceae bacterium]